MGYWDKETLLDCYENNKRTQIVIYRCTKGDFTAVEVRKNWRDRDTGEVKKTSIGLSLTVDEWKKLFRHMADLPAEPSSSRPEENGRQHRVADWGDR